MVSPSASRSGAPKMSIGQWVNQFFADGKAPHAQLRSRAKDPRHAEEAKLGDLS